MAVIKIDFKSALQIQLVFSMRLTVSHAFCCPAISVRSPNRFASNSKEDRPYGLSAVVLNFDFLLGYE